MTPAGAERDHALIDLTLIAHAVGRAIVSQGGEEGWLALAAVTLPRATHDRLKAGIAPGMVELGPIKGTAFERIPADGFRFHGLLFLPAP
jgi:hypothetical protein